MRRARLSPPIIRSLHPIPFPDSVCTCPGMCHNTAPSRRAAAPHSTGRASGSGSRHSAPEHRRSIPRPPRWTAQRHNTPRCARGRPASAAPAVAERAEGRQLRAVVGLALGCARRRRDDAESGTLEPARECVIVAGLHSCFGQRASHCVCSCVRSGSASSSCSLRSSGVKKMASATFVSKNTLSRVRLPQRGSFCIWAARPSSITAAACRPAPRPRRDTRRSRRPADSRAGECCPCSYCAERREKVLFLCRCAGAGP